MAKDLKKSMSAAIKAGDLYYMKGKVKMLAVTKEMLDKWKKDNKGNYDGKALTAYANAKGKKIKPVEKSLRPKLRGDSKESKITVSKLKPGQKGDLLSDRHEGSGPASKNNPMARVKKITNAAAEKSSAESKFNDLTLDQQKTVQNRVNNGMTRNNAIAKTYADTILEKPPTKKNKGGMIMKKKPTAKMMGGGMMRAKKKGASMYNKGGAAKKR